MRDVLANKQVSKQLLWVTGLLLSLSVIPHLENLGLWIIGMFFFLLALRGLLWREAQSTPSRWLLFPLLVAALILVVAQAGLYEGRRFGVALLIVMAGLKFLELKNRRDLYVSIFLGYFLLITLFLYHQTATMTGYVLLLSMGYTAILVSANCVSAHPDLRFLGTRAAWLVFSGIPVMILLFVFFPRLEGPLWTLKFNANSARTGITDNISMGSISELSRSEEVAFRVRFLNQPPPRSQWYWRGLVLWKTDGKNWSRAEDAQVVRLAHDDAANWNYEITMEASNQPWLFPLDRIHNGPRTLQLNLDDELSAKDSISSRFTFKAGSNRRRPEEVLSARDFTLGLQLPSNITSRVRNLALQWKNSSNSDAEIIKQALRYFNRQNFIYTLLPPLLGANPVDEFLFKTRRGFCEHYATAFVTLMRLADIPARVVLGYQGGELNPLGGHIIVRQSHAHAWAEVWLEDSGWTRVDPTAAVAPERIEQSIDVSSARPGVAVQFNLGPTADMVSGLMQKWGWLRDNMELSWHYWVIGFNQSRQKSLWNRMGLKNVQSYKMAIAGILGAVALGALAFLLSLRKKSLKTDEILRTYQQFQRKLHKCGLEIPSSMGPQDLLRTASEKFPQQRSEIQAILFQYISLRYGNHPQPRVIGAFKRRIKNFRCRAGK